MAMRADRKPAAHPSGRTQFFEVFNQIAEVAVEAVDRSQNRPSVMILKFVALHAPDFRI